MSIRSAVERRLDSGRGVRAILTAAVLVAYILAFLVLFPRLMTIVTILAVLPVAAIAWSGGLRAGVVAGSLALPLNTLLMNLAGASGWDVLIRRDGGIVGHGALLFIGAAFGWLHSTRARLRRQTEALASSHRELAGTEERLRLAIDATDDAIFDWNPASGRGYRSPRYRQMLGYGPHDEFRPGRWKEWIHPDDLDRVKQAEADHLAGRTERQDVEYRIRTKSGAYKWVAARGRAVRDSSGRPVRMFGAISDISRRKLAEERLRASQQRLGAVLDTIVDGVITVDDAGLIESINPATEKLFGYAAKDIVGRSISVLRPEPLHRESNDDFANFLRTEMSQINAVGRETTGRRKDGSTFPMELAASEMSINGKRLLVGIVRDISARRQAEEALRESEARYALVVNSTTEGLWEYDPRSNQMTYRSPRMVEFLGIKPTDDVSAKKPLDWAHPDDQARVLAAWNDYLAKRIPRYQVEYRVRAAGGQWRWIRAQGQAVWDESGRPVRLAGVTIDITREREAEAALRESEEEFRLAFDRAPSGIAISDLSGRFSRVNQAFAEMLGYTRDELTSMSFIDVTHPDDRARTVAVDRDLHAGSPRFAGVEKRYVRKDGGRVDAITNVAMVRDSNGHPLHGIAQVFDITERNRMEASLRHSEARHAAILHALPDLALRIHRDGTILDYHASDPGLLFAPPEHFLGKPLSESMPSDVAESVEAAVLDVLDSTEPRKLDYRLRLATGVRDFEARLAPSGTDEVLAIVRDVTDLRAFDRMKDEFISIVSHEMRTPLTSMRVSLGLLAAKELGDLSPSGHEMLDIAVSSTDRLVRLVNDVLDIERIKSGTVRLARVESDAAQLMALAIQTVAPLAEEAGVEIRATPKHVSLSADPDGIVQVLTNLLGNAVKFSPPGATVSIGVDELDGEVLFSVEDEGPGIPADQLEAIFDRFRQVGATNGRATGGFGLGLAISRSIVAMHEGRIWAESANGRGSTFWVALPKQVDGWS